VGSAIFPAGWREGRGPPGKETGANMADVKLEVRNLTKLYPGTVALSDFSAVMQGGHVYALLGKNGSGKSTLVKCISGAVIPTSGEMYLNDRKLDFQSPLDAFDAGIAIVYQELSLVLDFTVAENILIGRYFKKGPGGSVIDWRRTNERAAEILAALRIDIPVTEKVSSLSVGQRQMIEIAKAMSYNPSVLILDEPTSALAQQEIESLFRVVHQSRAQGVIVIFITHKLNEIRGVADYVTVIRDSRFVGTIPIAEANPKTLVDMMFGETQILSRPANLAVSDEVVLEVRELARGNHFSGISFQLHKGEILGIAGMLGSGRSELLRSIFGADPLDSGEIIIKGHPITRPQIPAMKKLGLAMTPENRKEEGLVQMLSIKDNLCFASLSSIASLGFLNQKRQEPVVQRWIRELHIKVSSAENEVSSLSGGNQQKIVVGNWLNTEPSIIFFDEPSRGIDVQAKQQIFQIMWDLSAKGLSVIFVSTELEELMEVCHRILIMDRGRIQKETTPEQTTLDELYALCMEA
jgi:ABC-type sugar transport system ATPase subunit